MVYEDFCGQLSFVEPVQRVEYVPSKTINPRNIGYSGHPLYSVWQSMRQRCHNPNAANYRFYGARGIIVCERWHDFQLFLEDMEESYPGKGYQIDRINENMGYEKGNCRWLKFSDNIKRANYSRIGTKYKKYG